MKPLSDFSHNHPVVLVTGGAVRIGKAIVLELASRGCDVLIHCRRSHEAAEKLRSSLASMGRRAWVVSGTLDSPRDCESLWSACREAAGRVDVLINNASIFNRTSLVHSDVEDFENHWRVNAFAPMWLTRLLAIDIAAAGRETDAPRASVVNLLDRRVALPEPDGLPYLTSKCALHAFTLSAALELAPAIRVNGVAPGAILPPPGRSAMPEPAGRAPLHQRCQPEDVARAVAFLTMEACITGQVLYVDAGQHLWSV